MDEKTIGLVPVFDNAHGAMSFPEGVTIILNDAFKTRGKLLKWRCNFAKYNIVKLQIWRPVAGSDTDFKNVHEQVVDCECKGIGLGDVEIAVPDDVQIEVNDRIGVAVQEGTLGISYTPIPPEKYQARCFDGECTGKQFQFETREYNWKLFVTATYREE